MRATDFKRLNGRPTGLTRITLHEEDGTKTEINLDEGLHYFFVFSKAEDSKEGRFTPVEILIKGDLDIVSEMFYQLGETHPSLIEHCAKRAFEKIVEQLKFQNAPVVGGVQ